MSDETHSALDALENFDPDENLIAQASYSSLTLHRKCAQAWYYRHGMRIERDAETSPYLTIGRWWSVLRAVEAVTRGRNAETLIEMPKLRDKDEGYDFDPRIATIDEVLFRSEQRWQALSRDEKTLFEEKLGADLPSRLRGMYGQWDAAHQDRYTREQPLAAEMFWKRQLPRPSGDLSWQVLAPEVLDKLPKMHLIGFVDYVYYDNERQMVVVRDDKASSDLGNATSALDDLMDSQLMLYAWGAIPKLRRYGIDSPRAVSYDRVRSVAPKTPVLTAAGRLSEAVTLYDLDTYKRWASTDMRPSPEEVQAVELERGMQPGGLQKVIDRMEPGPFWGKLGEFFASGPRKGLPKFGTYEIDDKVIEKLSAPVERARWVTRTFKPISRSVLQTHLRSAVDTALDIYQTQLRAADTGEAARSLDRRGCSMCDYADLCRAQLIGGPDGDYDLASFGLRQRPQRMEKQNG